MLAIVPESGYCACKIKKYAQRLVQYDETFGNSSAHLAATFQHLREPLNALKRHNGLLLAFPHRFNQAR